MYGATPLYVSTVDSGNLAVLLLTFRQGILEVPAQPMVGVRSLEALGDMVLVLAGQIRRRQQEIENGGEKQTLSGLAGACMGRWTGITPRTRAT